MIKHKGECAGAPRATQQLKNTIFVCVHVQSIEQALKFTNSHPLLQILCPLKLSLVDLDSPDGDTKWEFGEALGN